jgi:DNA-binding MarR family transcriptional regulator
MVDELVDRLDRAGFPGITASFHPVFENIDSGGTRLTELAARADVTHQAMGDLVSALEARGYVERRADPIDGRARLVCLTPLGRRMVRRALREMGAIEEAWQRRFEASGCPDFRAALEAAVTSARADLARAPTRDLAPRLAQRQRRTVERLSGRDRQR